MKPSQSLAPEGYKHSIPSKRLKTFSAAAAFSLFPMPPAPEAAQPLSAPRARPTCLDARISQPYRQDASTNHDP